MWKLLLGAVVVMIIPALFAFYLALSCMSFQIASFFVTLMAGSRLKIYVGHNFSCGMAGPSEILHWHWLPLSPFASLNFNLLSLIPSTLCFFSISFDLLLSHLLNPPLVDVFHSYPR